MAAYFCYEAHIKKFTCTSCGVKSGKNGNVFSHVFLEKKLHEICKFEMSQFEVKYILLSSNDRTCLDCRKDNLITINNIWGLMSRNHDTRDAVVEGSGNFGHLVFLKCTDLAQYTGLYHLAFIEMWTPRPASNPRPLDQQPSNLATDPLRQTEKKIDGVDRKLPQWSPFKR